VLHELQSFSARHTNLYTCAEATQPNDELSRHISKVHLGVVVEPLRVVAKHHGASAGKLVVEQITHPASAGSRVGPCFEGMSSKTVDGNDAVEATDPLAVDSVVGCG
jgi:hypothetical protein